MRQKRLGGLFAAAVFLLCAVMTGTYLIAGYGAYLDSDMASELALASHLAEEGKLISGTWVYSTEVRVLSTQLIFTPLMALFPHDWRLVRTLGCLILQGILAASAYFCGRALGADKKFSLLFAGLTAHNEKNEVVPGLAEDWSFDKLRAAYAALPPGAAAFDDGSTAEFILGELLSGGIYDFVDFEHAACDFESGEFASMLEFAASAAGNEHEGESFAAMENGELLLSTAYVYEPGLYSLYRAHSTDEEVSVVGYPSKSGGVTLMLAGGGFAISAASAHKEAAWEFVKPLLTDEYQSNRLEQMGFPTNAAAFEKYLAAEKAPPVGGGTAYHYGNGANFDSVTEQERQELRALIDGAAFARDRDYADIISIIREESAHFFAGNCSAKDCAARVQGRVGILLSEKFE